MKILQFNLFFLAIAPSLLITGYGQSNGKLSSIQIAGDQEPGERLEVIGKVLDGSGNPIRGAKLFFYQANSLGEYESTFLGMPSYARLRGTVYTDENGKFMLKTIVPGNYPGESEGKHIHVVANAKGYKEWKFEFLFEGWVSESLRKEIARNKDGIILNPVLENSGVWKTEVLITLVKN